MDQEEKNLRKSNEFENDENVSVDQVEEQKEIKEASNVLTDDATLKMLDSIPDKEPNESEIHISDSDSDGADGITRNDDVNRETRVTEASREGASNLREDIGLSDVEDAFRSLSLHHSGGGDDDSSDGDVARNTKNRNNLRDDDDEQPSCNVNVSSRSEECFCGFCQYFAVGDEDFHEIEMVTDELGNNLDKFTGCSNHVDENRGGDFRSQGSRDNSKELGSKESNFKKASRDFKHRRAYKNELKEDILKIKRIVNDLSAKYNSNKRIKYLNSESYNKTEVEHQENTLKESDTECPVEFGERKEERKEFHHEASESDARFERILSKIKILESRYEQSCQSFLHSRCSNRQCIRDEFDFNLFIRTMLLSVCNSISRNRRACPVSQNIRACSVSRGRRSSSVSRGRRSSSVSRGRRSSFVSRGRRSSSLSLQRIVRSFMQDLGAGTSFQNRRDDSFFQNMRRASSAYPNRRASWQVWPTRMGGQIRPPRMEGQVRPTRMGGQIRPSRMGGQIRPSRMGGQVRPSRMGGQIRPSRMEGQIRPTRMGGQVRPPRTKKP